MNRLMSHPFWPRSPALSAALTALCLGLLCASAPVGAQEAGSAAATPNQVLPRRPTFADQAYVLEPGQLQTETGYAAVFETELATLHVWDIYGALAVADLVEVRVGWDVINAAGDELGVGDLTLGVKGGFFGGIDERTALAGIFDLELPTASRPFGLRSGVRFAGGLVATTTAGTLQLDFQATADLHLFLDDPTFLIPLTVGLTWPAIDPLRIYADVVVALDLEDFSRTRTSLLGGLGWRIIPPLELNSGVRLGLSTTVPDVIVQVGVAWLVGDFF